MVKRKTIDIPENPQPKKMKSIHGTPDEKIAEALKKHRGLMYLAADALKMSYSHVQERVRTSPYLQKVARDASEKRIDVAEEKLAELMEERNLGSLIFFLKTRGKHRGYTETVEMQVPEHVEKQLDTMLLQLKSLQEQEKKD